MINLSLSHPLSTCPFFPPLTLFTLWILLPETLTYSPPRSHSLGGAQATIAAMDMAYRLRVEQSRIMLYTFGAPRVGT